MTSQPWMVCDTEEALIESQVNYLKFEIFESKVSMKNSNTGITEWRTNLAKTGKPLTEEALIESQVNYLNFEILESNFLRKIQILLLQSGRQI